MSVEARLLSAVTQMGSLAMVNVSENLGTKNHYSSQLSSLLMLASMAQLIGEYSEDGFKSVPDGDLTEWIQENSYYRAARLIEEVTSATEGK